VKTIILGILAFFIIGIGTASAEFYQWTDENGVMRWTDAPTSEIKEMKVIEGVKSSAQPEYTEKTSSQETQLNFEPLLKIVKHEPKFENDLILKADQWWHIEGQIFNPHDQGVRNVNITYPQFKAIPPVKIPYIPPKQTIDFKSEKRATSYGVPPPNWGMNRSEFDREYGIPPLKVEWRSDIDLIAEIKAEWD
jgi:hypothetical protein